MDPESFSNVMGNPFDSDTYFKGCLNDIGMLNAIFMCGFLAACGNETMTSFFAILLLSPLCLCYLVFWGICWLCNLVLWGICHFFWTCAEKAGLVADSQVRSSQN